METRRRQKDGFSLTEVLLAVATLAVGMIFIAGAFPVALHFSTEATERTIAAVVADEAFAKMRLIAARPHPDDANLPLVSDANFAFFNECRSFELAVDYILAPLGPGARLDPNVFAYPSLEDVAAQYKSYFWSAICRRTRPDGEPGSEIQATVFVCRKVGSGRTYWFRNPNDNVLSLAYPYPQAIYFGVSHGVGAELMIQDIPPADPHQEILINEGYTIVDDATGDIYRVQERLADNPATPINEGAIIILDRPWQGEDRRPRIWAVPAAGKTRYPCIAVYQKVMRF
jgi:type II secretory pathway pseudopilin PulG